MRGSRARNAAAALVTGLALVAAGCGGDDQATDCDDTAFRAQDEEVYVALAAAQNAQGGAGEPATLAEDLRRGAAALGRVLDTPPCDDELRQLAEDEQDAADALTEAADQLDAGEDATASLATAVETLSELETTLFGRSG